MSRLDEFLPEFEFVERHAVALPTPAPAAVAAARAVTPREMPLVRALFALRSLPALVTRSRGLPTEQERPLAEQLVELGFVTLFDAEDEFVLGYVGQPWRLTGDPMPQLRSPEEWIAFAEPGFVKAAMNLRADGSRLTTETRIHATDPGARRRFGRYWRVIRPGSGLIRRSWLGAAKRRAAVPPTRQAGSA